MVGLKKKKNVRARKRRRKKWIKVRKWVRKEKSMLQNRIKMVTIK